MISISEKVIEKSSSPTLDLPPDQWHRAHGKMAPPGIAKFLILFSIEIITNLPALFSLRRFHQKKLRHTFGSKQKNGTPLPEPVVACVSDNLDEVNGIALSSRIMLRKLRAQGHDCYLFGVAFHSRLPRTEEEDKSVVLAPGRYSMVQAGYAASEVTLIKMKNVIQFFREKSIDVIELQTPGPVAVSCLLVAKCVGIKTLSHYRTDIITYSKLLVKNQIAVWFINTTTKLVTHWSGPVIVPSLAYAEKVKEMGVATHRIFKLPRGVDFENFHPSKKQFGTWKKFNLPENGIKLLYVGRISKEKNLDLIAEAFPSLLKTHPTLSMTFVGEGPYRQELQARLASVSNVFFTGVIHGEDLASIFASADIMVFPSLTDTFGNSVVEALASGVPCITSNQGGPKEIIIDGQCGFIFDPKFEYDLQSKLLSLIDDPYRLAAFKIKARERALYFTYDRAAQAFWDFYCKQFQPKS